MTMREPQTHLATWQSSQQENCTLEADTETALFLANLRKTLLPSFCFVDINPVFLKSVNPRKIKVKYIQEFVYHCKTASILLLQTGISLSQWRTEPAPGVNAPGSKGYLGWIPSFPLLVSWFLNHSPPSPTTVDEGVPLLTSSSLQILGELYDEVAPSPQTGRSLTFKVKSHGALRNLI